ncbi:hypothetical protein OG897_32390 [Streptomyces sp. NBC_00237]|uniref:hypothetical protein n=1 Tax=Streptomyces sp. NBC_00237 TaxID=2975687 RepID=UPI002259B390|nr:hypothetical protein [Streptomyces sp. NBC_00237]MCX5206098.1 hypothetical protein [Streptomyces sp. NBC_00237]
MRDVLRMSAHEFWWDRPHDPNAHLGFVRFTCENPTADAWEVKFPRYQVGYGGWSCGRNYRLAVEGIAELDVAEQIRDHLTAEEGPHLREFWTTVRDLGRAPHEEFTEGSVFWARDAGALTGQKGSIVIRHRDWAAVQWDSEPFIGGTTFPLGDMSTTPPPPPVLRHSMRWLEL